MDDPLIVYSRSRAEHASILAKLNPLPAKRGDEIVEEGKHYSIKKIDNKIILEDIEDFLRS